MGFKVTTKSTRVLHFTSTHLWSSEADINSLYFPFILDQPLRHYYFCRSKLSQEVLWIQINDGFFLVAILALVVLSYKLPQCIIRNALFITVPDIANTVGKMENPYWHTDIAERISTIKMHLAWNKRFWKNGWNFDKQGLVSRGGPLLADEMSGQRQEPLLYLLGWQ